MINRQTTIECTINLHKRLHGVKFKNRGARAVFEIKKLAKSLLNTNQIRIDSRLNNQIWKFGPRHVPLRVRVRITKQKYISKENVDSWFVFISLINNKNFKKMQTKAIQ